MQAKENPNANHYAYPLDFYCYVNSAELCVTQIFRLPKDEEGTNLNITDDSHREAPWATTVLDPVNEYDPGLRSTELKKSKPLQIIQPQGPSFTTSANQIDWMGWEFSVGFNYVSSSFPVIMYRPANLMYREGMTIHNAHFNGRSTFYRLSLSE
jgi:primary-amine oxidase